MTTSETPAGDDHWKDLLSEMGIDAPAEQPSEAAQRPAPRVPERKERPAPAKREPAQADWNALAGELGIEIPPEPEAPPAAPAQQRRAGPERPAEEPRRSSDKKLSIFDVEFMDAFIGAPETGPAPAAAPEGEVEKDESRHGRGRRRRRGRGDRKRPEGDEEASVRAFIDETVEMLLGPEITAAEEDRGDQRNRPAVREEQRVLDDDVVESPAESRERSETEEGEEGEPRRRRRRRRRGGRGGRAERGREQPVRESRGRDRARDEESGGRRRDQDEPDHEPDECFDAEPAAARARAAEPEEDDLDDHEIEGIKQSHRGLPTWEEAVSVIIDANMEARAKNPSRPSQGRRRGGRRPRS